MDEKNNEVITESVEPVNETITLSKEELNSMLQEGFKKMFSDFMMTKPEVKPEQKEEKKEETLEDFLF